MNKNLTTWKGVKKGTKIKVISNSNGHNYPLNKVFTTKRTSNFTESSDMVEEFCGNSLIAYDCIIESQLISDFKQDLKELEKEIASLNSKIKTMEELGLEEYDENIIKIHQTLTLIDKKGISKIEKAKAIAALINES